MDDVCLVSLVVSLYWQCGQSLERKRENSNVFHLLDVLDNEYQFFAFLVLSHCSMFSHRDTSLEKEGEGMCVLDSTMEGIKVKVYQCCLFLCKVPRVVNQRIKEGKRGKERKMCVARVQKYKISKCALLVFYIYSLMERKIEGWLECLLVFVCVCLKSSVKTIQNMLSSCCFQPHLLKSKSPFLTYFMSFFLSLSLSPTFFLNSIISIMLSLTLIGASEGGGVRLNIGNWNIRNEPMLCFERERERD